MNRIRRGGNSDKNTVTFDPSQISHVCLFLCQTNTCKLFLVLKNSASNPYAPCWVYVIKLSVLLAVFTYKKKSNVPFGIPQLFNPH